HQACGPSDHRAELIREPLATAPHTALAVAADLKPEVREAFAVLGEIGRGNGGRGYLHELRLVIPTFRTELRDTLANLLGHYEVLVVCRPEVGNGASWLLRYLFRHATISATSRIGSASFPT